MYSSDIPKISVITVTFNAAQTLSMTMDSILAQDYSNVEHIIVDGKSNDNTIELVESYRQKYYTKGYELHIISQKDNGIYDAMNKGIQLASGTILGFLNADDFYAKNNVISLIAWGFAKPEHNINIVYGDVTYVNKDLEPVRNFRAKPYTKNAFKFGFHPPHPSFYTRRELYQIYGNFNLKYKIASDYELMLRFLEKYQLQILYIQEDFVKMRIGGISNSSFKNVIQANIECYESFRDNHLAQFPIFVILKPLSKLAKIQYMHMMKSFIKKFRIRF